MSHARLGPSNVRWVHCAGSIREEAQYPDISGDAAIDGTGSHLLLEMCLQNNVAAAQYDGQIIGANHEDNPGGWLVGPERIDRVQMCLDYVSRRVGELKQQFPDAQVSVDAESRSDPGGAFGRDDWWGTVDITITARHPMSGEIYFIEVCDYKDGRGYVSEKNNSQLNAYLFGKLRPYIGSGPDKVRPFTRNSVGGCRVTIVQLKTNPVVRYQCSTNHDHGFNVSTVVTAAESLAIAAHATDKEDASLVPGKHCQWCKANPKRGGHCTAQAEEGLEKVKSMSNDVIVTDGQDMFEFIGKSVADPKSLSVEQLSELASAKDAMMQVFDKIETEIQERIEQGVDVPGYAMAPGRGSRIWNEDEETIVKKLKSRRLKLEDIYPKKLISPAALLKLDKLTDAQKKKIESDLVSFKAGKLSLKKVAKAVEQSPTDVVQSAEMMFAEVPASSESTAEEAVKTETPVSFF